MDRIAVGGTATRRRPLIAGLATTVLVLLLALGPGLADGLATTGPPLTGTPALPCSDGDNPEPAQQGRVPSEVYEAGWAEPFRCNLELLDHHGATGGYKVHRYVDPAGTVCLYYDSTLVFPLDVVTQASSGAGVIVVDASDPRSLATTTTLTTPGMTSPHESLVLDAERGRLIGVMGAASTTPGVVDIYDLTQDCRRPVLLSSTSNGVLGHESGLSPDGRTLYVTSPFFSTFAAVDISDPTAPETIYVAEHQSHGVRVSPDGTRAYLSPVFGVGNDRGPFYSHPELLDGDGTGGLEILDVSSIQERRDDPAPAFVSELTWPEVSIPQVAIPFTRDGRPYLLEVDEFVNFFDGTTYLDPDLGFEDRTVGGVRVIDIADEDDPFVLSNIRLEVHDPEVRTSDGVLDDPGARRVYQGYAAHYCALPTAVDPELVACSMIQSGLRLFDISDPAAPVEVAYFNAPGVAGTPPLNPDGAPFAMSAPAFDLENRIVYYSDTSSGLYALQVDEAVWPHPDTGQDARAVGADPAAADEAVGGGSLAATGSALPAAGALLFLLAAAGVRRRR